MKGLLHIPGQIALTDAYARLQSREGVSLRPGEIALFSQWARFDPRLAEQLVTYLSAHWRQIALFPLREELSRQPWPAAMGVLLDQGRTLVPPSDRKLFRTWSDCLMAAFSLAPNELFFIGLRAFAGKAMRDDAAYSLKSFLRWGYLGREILLNKAPTDPAQTLLPSSTRQAFLTEYLKSHRRITVKDYLNQLENRVSQRQAERDLARSAMVKPIGKTRARVYIRK